MLMSALLGLLIVLQQPLIPEAPPDYPYESMPDPQGRMFEQLKFNKEIIEFQNRLLGTPFRYDG